VGLKVEKLLGALAGYGSLQGAPAQGSQASPMMDSAFEIVFAVNAKK